MSPPSWCATPSEYWSVYCVCWYCARRPELLRRALQATGRVVVVGAEARERLLVGRHRPVERVHAEVRAAVVGHVHLHNRSVLERVELLRGDVLSVVAAAARANRGLVADRVGDADAAVRSCSSGWPPRDHERHHLAVVGERVGLDVPAQPEVERPLADIRQSSCTHHPARFCRSGVRRPLWMPMLKLVTHGLIALKFHVSALNGSGNQSWYWAGVGAVGSPAGRPVAV